MSKQIFDQDRPRSTMAQRLDEAFAGCDEWTVIAAPRRRSTLDFSPRHRQRRPDLRRRGAAAGRGSRSGLAASCSSGVTNRAPAVAATQISTTVAIAICREFATAA